MKLLDFFEAAYKNEIAYSEMNSFIETHTSSFDQQRMYFYLVDLDEYYYKKRMDKLESLRDEEIIARVQEYKNMYGDLPESEIYSSGDDIHYLGRISPRMYFVGSLGAIEFAQSEFSLCQKITKRLFADSGLECIDFEEAVYPDEFDGIRKLLDVTNSILKKLDDEWFDSRHEISYVDKVSDDAHGKEPIKWLKSEEALRQLIESLKENRLIQSRETEDIIQHFEVSGREAKQAKLEPISWLKSKALLAYFIRQLHNSGSIAVDNIWHEMGSHFLFKGKAITGLRQSEANTYSYPKGSEIIDKLIKQ